MKLNLPNFLSFFVSLLTPIALIGLALRILLTPVYYTVEYSMPYFPAAPPWEPLPWFEGRSSSPFGWMVNIARWRT